MNSEQILKEIAEIEIELDNIANYLAQVTHGEEIGRSERLPKGTREHIFVSISKMLHLQQRLIGLQKKLGAQNSIQFKEKSIEETAQYWDYMIASGDLIRSHHINYGNNKVEEEEKELEEENKKTL